METSEFDREMMQMDEPQEEYQSLYKMVADNKIAISKKEGTLWKNRLDVARSMTQDLRDSWQNIIQVYKGCDKPSEDSEKKRLRMDEQTKTFENLVWANTNGISRETVMKLPHIEITCNREEDAGLAKAYEHLINNYMGQIGNCGLNCKEKLQKADIAAQLTNRGVWRLDWIDKVNRDLIQDEIMKLEEELAKCKTVDGIKDIEGKLYALNQKLEDSGFDGAQISLVDPCNLFVDPNSQLESCLDADWIIEQRLEYEHILKAKYGTKDGTVYAGEKGSIGSDKGNEDKVKIKDEDDDYVLGGERTQIKDERLRTVKTYYVWDKLKKRVYLFEEGKWEYPLWVWNDPLGLKQFFPYYVLSYNQSVVDNNMMSEVAFYLPLVNSINKINSQIDKARDRAFNVTLVDKNARIEEKDLQNMTNGKPGWVQVSTRDGIRVADAVVGMPTPGTENQMLMDKSGLYAMIGKMSSADALTRGEEYKTNTTNGAIQQYSQSKKVITGIKVDKLISFYLRVVKDVLALCLVKFDMDDLLKWCNPNDAMAINARKIDVFSPDLVFVGDDTIEPTSAAKKQEALQLTQLMGQFAGASPAVVPVVLKMLSRAFNEMVITDEDWDMIMQGFQQQQEQAEMQRQMQQQQMAMQAQQGQMKMDGMQQQQDIRQAQAQQNMQAKQQAMQNKMINQAAMM